MGGAGARRSPRSCRTSSTSRTEVPTRIRSSSRRISNSGSLYYPYHSFDWDIHHQVFDKYAKQIADITTDCGLWFSLDHDISTYRSPQDLLMVDVVKVQFKTTGNLITAAREQRELVRTYFDKPAAWADRELREKISASGKEHGDLRFRNLEVLPFPYTDIRAFYTTAFDGLYVLRDTVVGKPVLVLENNSSVFPESCSMRTWSST